MVNCYWCKHQFEHPPVDHWIDIFHTRAAVICPSCHRQFEVWAAEL